MPALSAASNALDMVLFSWSRGTSLFCFRAGSRPLQMIVLQAMIFSPRADLSLSNQGKTQYCSFVRGCIGDDL